MRLVFISPHLDDAILSVGGFIHDQARMGIAAQIWTLSGRLPPEPDSSPFAQSLYAQWGFASVAQAVHQRRLEDVRAAGIAGATSVHFEFLDCIYRRSSAGEWLYPASVFVPPHTADEALPAAMGVALAARLEPNDEIFCPLAIGGHVDHVLVRRAVEALGRPLTYFADMPYLLNHPEALHPLTQGKPQQVRAVSGQGLAAWLAGIESYRSQMSSLFESPRKMRALIGAYAQNGLRSWKLE